MATTVDKESLRAAYEDVRSDGSETNWATFKYEGPCITHIMSGKDFTELKDQFNDDDRAFAFVRVQAGDEMSKRMKFALITFIGPEVGPIKRAKVSTDKGLVKDIIANFAVEIQAESQDDIDENKIRDLVSKASGASYGTGQ